MDHTLTPEHYDILGMGVLAVNVGLSPSARRGADLAA